MAGNVGRNRLPDLYDPEQPLPHPTPLPVYHIAGGGGFVAKAGKVFNASPGIAHLEGSGVRHVVAQALAQGARVRRVYPGHTEWREVEALRDGA